MASFKKVELFGGAMEAEYPSSFFDVSDIRQVPDHQECFADRQSPNYFNVEILERIDDEKGPTDKEAFRFHALDVSDEDEYNVLDPSTVTLDGLPPGTPSLLGFCEGKTSSKNKYTGIIVLLIRLKEKRTDLLVSMIMQELNVTLDRFENGQGQSSRFQHAATVMDHFRETFKIKDWDLFV